MLSELRDRFEVALADSRATILVGEIRDGDEADSIPKDALHPRDLLERGHRVGELDTVLLRRLRVDLGSLLPMDVRMHVDDRIGELAEGLREFLVVKIESVRWFHRSVEGSYTV